MVLPTSPPASMSVSQILAEFGITAGTTKRISNDLFPLVGGTAGTTCLLGASFSGKSAAKVGYSTIGGTVADVGNAITVDSAGNIYVTGYYTSTTTVPINTFGAAPTASPYSLPVSVGIGSDMFVIKWNANGTVAGYTTIRGTGADVGYGIAVDSSQNIYVTGQYISSTTVPINTFGTAPTASVVSMPITTPTTISDAFVIKWNANGTVAGYSTIKGSGSDIGNGIAVDSSQNIYITGQYVSTANSPINTFGTAPTASGFNLGTGSGTHTFVIKWNGSTGAVAGYSLLVGGTGTDIGRSIAVDSSQNIYITGQYTSTATVLITTFGAPPTNTGVFMPNTTSSDAFVIKWNASGGTVAGYTNIKGTNADIGYGIAVDSSQNIYVTGQYQSTGTVPIRTFGTAPTASGVSMPAATGQDAFVIKWNGSNGSLAGYSRIGGNINNTGHGIALDSSQNIYITGQYNSSATVPINTFGTAPAASGVSMPITTGQDAFVIKWNGSNGTVAGYTTIKGTGTDIGRSIAVDSSQNIYVTGQYISSTTVPINTFGTAPTSTGVSMPITTPTTISDAFVIKWIP